MAQVIESVASTSQTSTSSLSITKPTGLEVGDLLQASIFEISGGTPSTPSGWTAIGTLSNTAVCRSFAKIADSSDVAASSFSFAPSSGTQLMAGTLIRVSGSRSDTLGDDFSTAVQDNTATPSTFSPTVTPETDSSVLVLMMVLDDLSTSGSTTKDVSLPVINGTNPSWTRQLIVGNGTSTTGIMYAVFTAVQASLTDITSLSATYNPDGMLAGTDTGYLLVSYGASTDASGSNALLEVSPTTFTQNGSGGTTGTSTLLEVSPTIPTQSGKATSTTVWTNETEPSTTWTNEDK